MRIFLPSIDHETEVENAIRVLRRAKISVGSGALISQGFIRSPRSHVFFNDIGSGSRSIEKPRLIRGDSLAWASSG